MTQFGYGIHYGEPASASGLSLHGQQLTSGALFPVNRRVVGSNLTWGANSFLNFALLGKRSSDADLVTVPSHDTGRDHNAGVCGGCL